MRPPFTYVTHNVRGVSVIELLLIIAMVSVMAGFALMNYVQGQRAAARSNTGPKPYRRRNDPALAEGPRSIRGYSLVETLIVVLVPWERSLYPNL